MSKQLSELVLADLARSGLDEADAKRLKIKAYTKEQAKALKLKHAEQGYLIPYFDITGKPTKFFRYRYLGDTRTAFEKQTKAKARKYEQPPKTAAEIYLPPFTDWQAAAADPNTLTIITEGEKKAAAATKAGLPTIGLGGVWSFQSTKQAQALLPALQAFDWQGRDVWIVYDSDASTNPQVRMAEQRLADALVREGALVHITRLPNGPEGEKVGLDDYLIANPVEALKELLNETPEFVDCRALHELNEKVVLAREGCHIYSFRDGFRMNAPTFTNVLFANERFTRRLFLPKGGEKLETVSTAKEWMEWTGRAEVRRFVFEPGEARPMTDGGDLNLWPGFPHEPEAGDVRPWNQLLGHIFGEDKAARKWFEQWAAYPIQHPGTKLRTAVVIWGRVQGSGKSMLGFTLGDLYGDSYTKIGDHELENPNFNTWQANKQFVVGDDVTGQASRKLANRLKVMVTSETISINEKYVNPYTLRDCINYYFTSNHADAFYMEEGDRRYFIHEVRGGQLAPEVYQPYDAWRRSAAGLRALMHHLMNLDLKGFDPMAPALVTTSKRDMIENTRTDVEDLIIGMREEPESVLAKFGGGDLLSNKELMAVIDPSGNARINEITVGKKMKEYGLEAVRPTDLTTTSLRAGGERVRLYPLRNAARWRKATSTELREHWEKHRKHLKR